MPRAYSCSPHESTLLVASPFLSSLLFKSCVAGQLNMGKRKKSSSKPQGPRKREPLATTFSCLFCNHENSVVVKLDKKLGLGDLSCKVCGQKFQTGINYLSAPVDVYSDWVDACDAVAKDTANQYDAPNPSQLGHRGISKQGIPEETGQGDSYDDDY
ncbi:unnamed protein product [Penicillium glandicola]